VASGQVIDFTIGSGGSGGAPKSGGSNGSTTTVTIYGQSILTCTGGLGSTEINGADGPSSACAEVMYAEVVERLWWWWCYGLFSK